MDLAVVAVIAVMGLALLFDFTNGFHDAANSVATVVAGLQRVTTWHDNHPLFKGAQLVSAAGLSFGHGANDAQKTMGVIAALMLGAGYTTMSADGSTVLVPEWVALSAYAAITLGTLWGGWKIIETMGLRLTTLHANSGTAANIGATTAIFGATALGMPISTTHAAASSIIGAGIGSGQGARWRVVGEMLLAWVVTIPAAGLIAFGMVSLTRLPRVIAWITIGTTVIAFAAWAIWAMMHTIHAKDVEEEILPEEELETLGHVRPHLRSQPPAA